MSTNSFLFGNESRFCIFTVKLNICVSENRCVCSKGLKKTEQIQGISKKNRFSWNYTSDLGCDHTKQKNVL
jgi:hypothetical protein